MKTSSRSILVVLLITQAICTGQSLPDSQELERALQMHAAVLRRPDVGEVQRILKAGFDANAPIGCGTYGALDGAVQVENMEILTLLLDAGAEPKGSA